MNDARQIRSLSASVCDAAASKLSIATITQSVASSMQCRHRAGTLCSSQIPAGARLWSLLNDSELRNRVSMYAVLYQPNRVSEFRDLGISNVQQQHEFIDQISFLFALRIVELCSGGCLRISFA